MDNNSRQHCLKAKLLSASVVAKILQINISTLRTYELEGLIYPEYIGGQKGFSIEQINWISCLRHMIQDKGISIPGLIRLLKLAPCWEIAQCPHETINTCKARAFSMKHLTTNKEKVSDNKDHASPLKYYNECNCLNQAIH